MKRIIQIFLLFILMAFTGIIAQSKIISFTSNNDQYSSLNETKLWKFYQSEESPKNFELYQNYPNPFNPSTTIRYDVAKESNVSLKVFNLLGQQVMVLVNQVQKPGTYSVKFNATGLNSGLYIYRLQTDDFVKVRNMVYLK